MLTFFIAYLTEAMDWIIQVANGNETDKLTTLLVQFFSNVIIVTVYEMDFNTFKTFFHDVKRLLYL